MTAGCYKKNADGTYDAIATCFNAAGLPGQTCDATTCVNAETGGTWGDLAAVAATDCGAITCAANEYSNVAPAANKHLSTEVCTACPAGTSSPAGVAGTAGGDASLAVTAAHCVAWMCPENYHRMNNYCVACVTGKYIAAATSVGADTVCAAKNCNGATDQRVVNGACAPCQAGTAAVVSPGTRNTWVAEPTAGACATTAALGTARTGTDCGVNNNLACTNKINCEASAATPATWTPGSCVDKKTGAARTGTDCAVGNAATCVNKANCNAAAAAPALWLSAGQAKGSLKGIGRLAAGDANGNFLGNKLLGVETGDATAANLDCAPITCKAGSVANGNTNAYGEAVVSNVCVPCPAGTTLRDSANTADKQAATGLAVAQTTGYLTHGVFAINGGNLDALYGGGAGGSTAAKGLDKCFAQTCTAQQQVKDHVCVACDAGKWNKRGLALFTTAVNAPCASVETCGAHQYRAATGRCLVRSTGVVAAGSHANLAACIAADALNIWSYCTSCPSTCIASATYVSAGTTSYSAGDVISGNNCGAAKNTDCTIKANCVHANVGGVWSGSFRQLLGTAANSRGAVKLSTDASETASVCATQCNENEYVDVTGTTSCFPDASISTASEDSPVGGAAGNQNEAACIALAGSTFHPKCTACADGEIRGNKDYPHISGATVCYNHKCPAGYAINGKKCMKCAAGKTIARALSGDGDGADETCTPTLCKKDFAVKSHVCTACPAGKSISYSGTNGVGVAGAAGDASLTDTTCHATVCNVDYHVVDIGSGVLRCRKCSAWQTRPAGDSTGGAGAAATSCVDRTCANLNEYAQDDTGHTCATCPVWEGPNTALQARGTVKAASAVKCVEITCAADEYIVITGTCATKDGGGARAGNDCGADNQQPCASKASCEASAAAPAAWTKTGATCTACATGTKLAAASLSATQASTKCANTAKTGITLDATCDADHFVENHKCKKCATGKSRAAGDDPNSNVDTACAYSVTPLAHGEGTDPHDTLCLANFHVQNFACVECPGGTTNNAGDDPHHYDTTCQKTLCKVNEYVKAHVCTPCSAAHGHTTNTAGDDASGADTTCY